VALGACRSAETGAAHASTMYDCRFQNSELVHLHISEQSGSVSVISDYKPTTPGSHSDHVRNGRESEGRLVPPRGGDRHTIELFLFNDHFGETAGDKVVIHMAGDGRTRIESHANQDQHRTLDFGTCSKAHPDGPPSS